MAITGQRPMALRTVRRFPIPTVGEALEQRATRLYKLSARLLPHELLGHFCVSFFKIGVFFLQVFEVFLDQEHLRVEQGDMLFKSARALSAAEGSNQSTECGK